jgi:hypothetical protein
VLDSVDDLIDDLTVQMRNTLDDLDRQLERITAVRATVASALDALKPAPVAVTPTTATPAPTLTVVPNPTTVEATPTAFICDVCGDVLASANGLAIHKGRKHKDWDVWTPEPMTKTGVDEVAARAAAAAAL